jgi:hypothetical protein
MLIPLFIDGPLYLRPWVTMNKRRWTELTSGYKNLPKKISQERLEEIMPFFRRIDISASQKKEIEKELIIGHLRLGVAIVLDFPAVYYHLETDDLIGEMELAVTRAVRRAKRGALQDNNITGFIISYVKHYIREELIREIYNMPTRTVRHFKEHYRHCQMMAHTPIEEDYPELNFDHDDYDDLYRAPNVLRRFAVPETKGDYDEVDVRDLKSKILRSPEEERLIELRESGYTVEDISEILETSKRSVFRMLTEIKDRYDMIMKKAE